MIPVSVEMDELHHSDYGHKRTQKWVAAQYPAEWQSGRAPIVEERQRMGTRSHGNWVKDRGFSMSQRDRDETATTASSLVHGIVSTDPPTIRCDGCGV